MTAYGTGFFTGGQDKGHLNRMTKTYNFKSDLHGKYKHTQHKNWVFIYIT